jgi:hypothetical protein
MAGPSSAAHPPLDSCGGPTNWNGTHACAGRPCRRREGVGQASGPTARQSRLRLARPHSLNFFTGEKGGNAGSAGRPGPTRPRQGSHVVPYFLAFIAFFMAFFAGAAAGAAAFFIAFMAFAFIAFIALAMAAKRVVSKLCKDGKALILHLSNTHMGRRYEYRHNYIHIERERERERAAHIYI